jgi:hypothetical protein
MMPLTEPHRAEPRCQLRLIGGSDCNDLTLRITSVEFVMSKNGKPCGENMP